MAHAQCALSAIFCPPVLYAYPQQQTEDTFFEMVAYVKLMQTS